MSKYNTLTSHELARHVASAPMDDHGNQAVPEILRELYLRLHYTVGYQLREVGPGVRSAVLEAIQANHPGALVPSSEPNPDPKS